MSIANVYSGFQTMIIIFRTVENFRKDIFPSKYNIVCAIAYT